MSFEIDKLNEVYEVNQTIKKGGASKKKRKKIAIIRNDTDRNIPQGAFIPGTPIDKNPSTQKTEKSVEATSELISETAKDSKKKTLVNPFQSIEDPDTTTTSLAQAAINGDNTALNQLNQLLSDRNPAMVLSAQKALNSVLSHKNQQPS